MFIKQKGLSLEMKGQGKEWGREELLKRQMGNKNSYINELQMRLLNKVVAFEEIYGRKEGLVDQLEDDQNGLKERNQNTWCTSYGG